MLVVRLLDRLGTPGGKAAYLILGENEQRRYNQELNRFLDAMY
jgi:hypothetical protein